MIDLMSKGLTQKSAVIKGGQWVSPSRAFALWLALLILYFLLLPATVDPAEAISRPAMAGERTRGDDGGVRRLGPALRR